MSLSRIDQADQLLMDHKQPTEYRLRLKGDASLPRELSIGLDRHGHFTAHIISKRYRSIAFAYHKMSECQLRVDQNGEYSLLVDHAAFDVTPKEAAEIHATFAPIGLKSELKDESKLEVGPV
jgi:hypothetical protein